MIHLDTSFLIRALVPGSTEGVTLVRWIGERAALAMSTVAWGEFLCGPIDQAQAELASRVVRIRVPLDVAQAERAAALFNATGRRRGSFTDCLVAATALMDEAPLATSDRSDFERFAPEGLDLVG